MLNEKSQIMILQSKKEESNLVLSSRNLLSMALLFLFISSIMGGARARGKGGQASPFMETSKSKRFQQKINVKFNDVVGMQKAKE